MISKVAFPRLVVLFVVVVALAGAHACDKKDPVVPDLETAIRGKVTDIGTSAPVESVEVWISPPGTTMVYTTSAGEYRHGNLKPGSYDLVVMKSYYEIKSRSVVVTENQTTQASFVIEEVVDENQFDFWGAFRRHHYYVSKNLWQWKDARMLGLSQGGYMVAVADASEDSLVLEISESISKHVAIGLTDELLEGTWVWVTGEPSSYFNWLSGEPNNSNNEDFVMKSIPSGQWNDYNGVSLMHFVLEIE